MLRKINACLLFASHKSAWRSEAMRLSKKVKAMLPSLDTTYPTLILKASRGVIHHGALEMATDAGVSSVSTFETDSSG